MAKKCLCAADLTRLITIKRLVIGTFSEPINETDAGNWVKVASEWAQILTRGSVEYTVGERVEQRILYRVTIRWSQLSSRYTSKMRFELDGRVFNIAGPPMNVDEKDNWLQFDAIEVPPTVI